MTRSQLKVCGITREKDGYEALSTGASFIGFILYAGSPRCIAPNEAHKLWAKIKRSGTFSVAVEVDPSPARLREIDKFGFDFIQLHFPCSIKLETVSEWAEISGAGRLWLAPRISPQDSFPDELLPYADSFLIDAYDEAKFGGTGLSSDWERFSQWKNKYPEKKWILAGGIGPENLENALSKTAPDIIDVNSSVEKKPGLKNHDKLKKISSFF